MGNDDVSGRLQRSDESTLWMYEEIITKKSLSSAIASSLIDSLYILIASKEEVETADLKTMLNLILLGKQ